jgi:hypothetical protein
VKLIDSRRDHSLDLGETPVATKNPLWGAPRVSLITTSFSSSKRPAWDSREAVFNRLAGQIESLRASLELAAIAHAVMARELGL